MPHNLTLYLQATCPGYEQLYLVVNHDNQHGIVSATKASMRYNREKQVFVAVHEQQNTLGDTARLVLFDLGILDDPSKDLVLKRELTTSAGRVITLLVAFQWDEQKRNVGKAAAVATTAAVATPFAANAAAVGAVGAIGFSSGGIAAGSTAASMMSAAAVANGGGVAAGSTVAALQSIGATGVAMTPVGMVALGVGGAVAATAWLCRRNQPKLHFVLQPSESAVTDRSMGNTRHHS